MGADGDTDIEAVADRVRGLADDVFDIQAVELKPLAFGLRFIQPVSYTHLTLPTIYSV